MTSRKISRDYLGKVEVRVEALRLFLARGRHDDVVREAHEAIELLLKGALRFIGIDPPKRHDPAPVLLRHLDRLPPVWRQQAEEIRDVSERLFSERGHAFYGDEDDLLPPSALFEREEAEEVIAFGDYAPDAPADRRGALAKRDAPAGGRERDRRRQTVRPGADDDGVRLRQCAVRSARRK